MSLMEQLLNSFNTVGMGEVFLRIAMAGLFSFILGYERQSQNKPMGCRSYMIVSMTTCLLAIMGIELAYLSGDANGLYSLDLGKIISGTVTGIGFLGAGAILKLSDDNVIGTATGSSIWASGILGLVIGFGFYALALIGYLFVIAILLTFGTFTKSKTKKIKK